MPFRQYVRPGHARLVINGYVTPHFKGGLRQARALPAKVNRQRPQAPPRRSNTTRRQGYES